MFQHNYTTEQCLYILLANQLHDHLLHLLRNQDHSSDSIAAPTLNFCLLHDIRESNRMAFSECTDDLYRLRKSDYSLHCKNRGSVYADLRAFYSSSGSDERVATEPD